MKVITIDIELFEHRNINGFALSSSYNLKLLLNLTGSYEMASPLVCLFVTFGESHSRMMIDWATGEANGDGVDERKDFRDFHNKVPSKGPQRGSGRILQIPVMPQSTTIQR